MLLDVPAARCSLQGRMDATLHPPSMCAEGARWRRTTTEGLGPAPRPPTLGRAALVYVGTWNAFNSVLNDACCLPRNFSGPLDILGKVMESQRYSEHFHDFRKMSYPTRVMREPSSSSEGRTWPSSSSGGSRRSSPPWEAWVLARPLAAPEQRDPPLKA